MTNLDAHQDAEIAERTERRWATISVIVMIVLSLMAAFAGIHQATMPQARVETIDPTRLHLSGEFVETNLGTAVEPKSASNIRSRPPASWCRRRPHSCSARPAPT